MTWAALRRGFGSGIWAEHFQSACLEAQLSRNDFLALRPTTHLNGFTKYPADWADANRCLHALLVVSGMPVEGLKYSMHLCRHVYLTCALQLLVPPPLVSLVGHWAAKEDKSSSVYDGARTATELAYKSNLAENVRGGWRLVAQGAAPQKPLVALAEAAVAAAAAAAVVPPPASSVSSSS